MPNCTWPSSQPFWGTSTLVTPWCTPLRSCQSCRALMLTLGSGWARSRLPGSGPSTLWGLQLEDWEPWCSTTWLDGKWAFWCQRCHRLSGGSDFQKNKHSASLTIKSMSILTHGYFFQAQQEDAFFSLMHSVQQQGHVDATVTQWARPHLQIFFLFVWTVNLEKHAIKNIQRNDDDSIVSRPNQGHWATEGCGSFQLVRHTVMKRSCRRPDSSDSWLERRTLRHSTVSTDDCNVSHVTVSI